MRVILGLGSSKWAQGRPRGVDDRTLLQAPWKGFGFSGASWWPIISEKHAGVIGQRLGEIVGGMVYASSWVGDRRNGPRGALRALTISPPPTVTLEWACVNWRDLAINNTRERCVS